MGGCRREAKSKGMKIRPKSGYLSLILGIQNKGPVQASHAKHQFKVQIPSLQT